MVYFPKKKEIGFQNIGYAGVSIFAGGDGGDGDYANGHEHGYSYSAPSSYSYSQVSAGRTLNTFSIPTRRHTPAINPTLRPSDTHLHRKQHATDGTRSTFLRCPVNKLTNSLVSLQSEMGYHTVTAPGSSIRLGSWDCPPILNPNRYNGKLEIIMIVSFRLVRDYCFLHGRVFIYYYLTHDQS
jgi:hypothetical protein